jgi:hypothetical protein
MYCKENSIMYTSTDDIDALVEMASFVIQFAGMRGDVILDRYDGIKVPHLAVIIK